jgi:hypothetical protein
MFEQLLETIRREVAGARALDSVRSLASFHRVQSSPGYVQASEWMAARLREAGLEPEVEHAPGDGRTRALGILQPRGWTCEHARAELVAGGRREPLCDYASEKLSLVLRSAPARGRFPLIAVDDGTDPRHYQGIDVRGRVVLTRGAVHRVHALAVIERGAAGLLSDGRRLLPPVRSDADVRDALPYTSFWWAPETPRGWGFVVTPERGADLRARLGAGEALEIDLAIESREYEAEVPLLSASLPGAGKEEVLIVAHLCHPQPSANDNASGAAALLETARVLGVLHRNLGGHAWKRGVRFLWVPELTGTAAWFARDRERARRTVAALNLDMVGQDQAQCGSTMHIEHPPCFTASFAEIVLARIRHEAQDWVHSYSGAGHYSMVRMAEIPYGGGSDHVVLLDPTVGVPCPMLIQWPDRFYHSSHDTPDRCDPASLALAVRCAATYAGFLAALDDASARGLLDVVARDAKRRFLESVDAPEPARSRLRARTRGRRAIESLSRLLDDPPRVAAAVALFEGFCEREGERRDAPAPREAPDGVRAQATAGARCPRRLVAGPLEFHAHLFPGHASLGGEEREQLHAFLARVPGGRVTLDIAWAACDGRRSIDEIAHLTWLETGTRLSISDEGEGSSAPLFEFFRWTDRLGLTSWNPAAEMTWQLDPRDAAAR